MRSLEKGGPDAIFEARKMRSPESLRACLNGFDEYGESFAEFAKKADDLGVRKFDELKPELKRLPKNKLDDILKNPVKYFDANGRPLSALDDLLKSVPKVSVFERMGQIIYWTKNVVVVGGMVYVADQFIKVYQKLNEFKEWLRELFKPWCGSSLADILANSVWWIFLLGSVWLLVALFFPSIRSLGLSTSCVFWYGGLGAYWVKARSRWQSCRIGHKISNVKRRPRSSLPPCGNGSSIEVLENGLYFALDCWVTNELARPHLQLCLSRNLTN